MASWLGAGLGLAALPGDEDMSALPLAPAFADFGLLPQARVQEREQSTFRLALPVVVVALAVGVAAVTWGFISQTLLEYVDAQAHLWIARRILDSRTPSLAQLGSFWLPVPHLLLMLFVYFDPLWTTGLAGSILGICCLAITAASLFLSTLLVTERKSIAWLSVAVLLTNPNILYLHTTAMTEPVLFASMTASMYFMLKWGKTQRWPDLIAAGSLAALAVGSRYEGWVFTVACAALVIWISYWITNDRSQAEGSSLAFLVPPAYAIGLWVFYNWLIFKDPLLFLHGEFAAVVRAAGAAVATKGNLPLSLQTYGYACIDTIGVPLLAAAGLGLIAYLVRNRLHARTLLPYAYISLFGLDVLLLYMGQIEMVTPQSTPSGIYNIRYALPAVPAVAFFVAYLADTVAKLVRPGFVVILTGVLLASQAAFYAPDWPHSLVTWEEPVRIMQANPGKPATANYLRTHYDGGGILIDESASDWITLAGIHLKEYVMIANGQQFIEAVNQPAEHVKWVVIAQKPTPDRVGALLLPDQIFHSQFQLVQTFDAFQVYERQD